MTEVVTTLTAAIYLALIFIGIVIVYGAIRSKQRDKREETPYRFIMFYKNCTIFEDVRDQHYFALDKNEKLASNRASVEEIKNDLDEMEDNLNSTQNV